MKSLNQVILETVQESAHKIGNRGSVKLEAKAKKPKWWGSMFATIVIDAYKSGELINTPSAIKEWEIKFNRWDPVTPLGTAEILAYHIATGEDPRDKNK